MRNLLIGNGLNLTNKENDFLYNNRIVFRFKENLKKYYQICKEMFRITIYNFDGLLDSINENEGIEIVAGKVFDYIHDEVRKTGEFSWNDCYRLIELISEIAIKSIFFENKTFKIPTISDEYQEKIKNTYNNIFSLNYIEDWDIENKVIYLHGNIKKYINNYCDISSKLLTYNDVYKKFKNKDAIKIDFSEIIFIPTNYLVDKYIYVEEGLFPQKCGLNVYPANDLFPDGGRAIYGKIEEIDSLDIFGVSPYGDEALIKKISKIPQIRIYIYNLNQNEILKWKEKGINAEFIDSKEFLKE